MTFCDEHGTADYCGECVYGPELESLQQQLAAAQAEIECEERRFSEQQDLLHSVIQERDAAQAEARELRERAEKAERNYQWMVERAADQHLSGYRELARRAADAENVADGLRAELARVRELIGVWRRMHKAAVQVNDGHETAHHAVLKTCADQLDAALSRAAERESLPLTFPEGMPDKCEWGHQRCTDLIQRDKRRAAQESGDAQP